MPVELIYKHQQKTYNLMQKQLKATKKAAYIFPTGCGKSFPVLKHIEENPNKKVLIVTPTRMINKQYKEYIKEYVENGEERLRNKDIFIITYSKLSLLNLEKINPEIIVLDEMHRTGAETYEPAVDRLLEKFNNAEIIAISATPERTDGRDMMEEKFEGNIVYEMSLTEALSGEKEDEVILKTPRYIRVISELKNVLQDYRRKIEEIEDIQEKEELFRKYERMKRIIEKMPGIEEVMKNRNEKEKWKIPSIL